MAWKLHFVVYCVTVVISSAQKYPTNYQSPWLAAFPEEGRSYYDRSLEASPSFAANYRRNLLGVPQEVITNTPRTQESTQRIQDISSRNSSEHKRTSEDNSKIIFPGPTMSSPSGGLPEIPEHCKHQTYCEDVQQYPYNEADALIKQRGNKRDYPLDKINYQDTPVFIDQRVGPAQDNVELCNFKETVVYPQAAVGPDDKWYTLVNRKEDPVQGFRVEICDADRNCSSIVYFQNGYTGRCKQKYVLRTAVTLEKSGDTFKEVERQVKMPSCCTCVAKTTIV